MQKRIFTWLNFRRSLSSKRNITLATLGICGFSAILIALAWSSARRNALNQNLPFGISAIPQDAALVLSVNTEVGQWQSLRHFSIPETQSKLDQLLADWRYNILGENGIDFNQDVKPWIGENVTFAILNEEDFSTNAERQDPGAVDLFDSLILAPVSNPEDFAQIFDRHLKLEIVEEYQGTNILSPKDVAARNFYAASLGDEIIIFGENIRLLEKSIDAYQESDSLQDKAGLVSAFRDLDKRESFVRFYVSAVAVEDNLSKILLNQNPAGMDSLSSREGFVGAGFLEPRGIRLQGISWLGPDSTMGFEASDSPKARNKYIPGDALMIASASNFLHFWQSLQSKQNLGTTFLPLDTERFSQNFQSFTGLSLEEDFLPWMNGELFLAVLVPPNASKSELKSNVSRAAPQRSAESQQSLPNPAAIATVQVSDPQSAEAALEKLDRIMAERHNFSVENIQFNDQEITQWTAPFGSFQLNHGWLEEDVVFLSIGQGVAELTVDSEPVSESQLFRRTMNGEATLRNGYFFIDLRSMRQNQNSLLLPPLPDTSSVLQAIETVGLSTTLLGERKVRYDLFVAMQRGRRPRGLPEAGNQGGESPDHTDDSEES